MTWAAVAALLVLSQAETPAPAQPQPRGMPTARLYLGPSAGQQGGQEVGTGAVVGYQGFHEITPSTASFWGFEILGWKVGSGVLPIFTGDFGLRWAPFPFGWVKPFVTGNVGVSLLVILPVPSLAAGVGVAVPLGDAIRLDATFRVRGALNIFNTNASVSIASIEFGVGF